VAIEFDGYTYQLGRSVMKRTNRRFSETTAETLRALTGVYPASLLPFHWNGLTETALEKERFVSLLFLGGPIETETRLDGPATATQTTATEGISMTTNPTPRHGSDEPIHRTIHGRSGHVGYVLGTATEGLTVPYLRVLTHCYLCEKPIKTFVDLEAAQYGQYELRRKCLNGQCLGLPWGTGKKWNGTAVVRCDAEYPHPFEVERLRKQKMGVQ
jgi:hypothetical protein